jgi:protein TonB
MFLKNNYRAVLLATGFVGAMFSSVALNAQTAQSPAPAPAPAATTVYTESQVDVKPTFAGGEQALWKYLAAQVEYPATARRDNAQGTIRVGFTVKADGSITSVFHAGDPELDNRLIKEAMRVIKAMPAWTPAEKGGQKVDCKMEIPVKFKLG